MKKIIVNKITLCKNANVHINDANVTLRTEIVLEGDRIVEIDMIETDCSVLHFFDDNKVKYVIDAGDADFEEVK